jgi:hypothetical protein
MWRCNLKTNSVVTQPCTWKTINTLHDRILWCARHGRQGWE